jgi:hypothetical protein
VQLTKSIVERGLEGEITHHRGSEKISTEGKGSGAAYFFNLLSSLGSDRKIIGVSD